MKNCPNFVVTVFRCFARHLRYVQQVPHYTPQHIFLREYSASLRDSTQCQCRGQGDPPIRTKPEWDRALNAFGYTGIREFERTAHHDVVREKAEIYERAREIHNY